MLDFKLALPHLTASNRAGMTAAAFVWFDKADQAGGSERLAYAPNMPLLRVMRCTMGIRLMVALKPRALMMALAMSEYRACQHSRRTVRLWHATFTKPERADSQ